MRIAALCAGLALAACQVQVNVPGPIVYPTPHPADDCGSHRYQWLVGRPESDLQGVRFSQRVNIQHTDARRSYRNPAGLLTIVIDQTDTIVAVYCG